MNGKNSLILYVFTLFFGILFIVRLAYLQIIDTTFRSNPLNNSSVTAKYEYPNRGYIYDRNGELLVNNVLFYDVMFIPNQVNPFDTLTLCKLLKIDKLTLKEKFDKAIAYSPMKPSVMVDQMSKEDYATLQEKMFQFHGFYIQKRNQRYYPHPVGANVLGYISQVGDQTTRDNPYYQMGDMMGTQGVEKQYEDVLRGIKGVNFVNKNIHNVEVGSYKNGKYDTLAVAGKDLTLSLDYELQQYGEWLMANKRGGVVAIEPATGEILALVTAPNYDPNIMVGRQRSVNFNKMYVDDFDKPLYDRSLLAEYAPGSTFKPINSVVALHLGSMDVTTTTQCYGGYRYGVGAFMACHCGTHGRPISMREGIFRSCNSYFAITYKRSLEKFTNPHDGLNKWSESIKKFGLGKFLGVDLPTGRKGLIPNSDYYDYYYPNKNWRASTTISNAIGQGEVLATPIQLANMTATIANRGFYYAPHVVKAIDKMPIKDPKYTVKQNTGILAEHFEPVVDGMEMVFNTRGGTAYASQVEGISICGKTGTAENFARISGKRIQFEDHSIFIAFAPKYNPKIAIAVFVENGGFGATIAAPIASLMIEKYINGDVKSKDREQRIHNINLYSRYHYYWQLTHSTHDSLQ